MVKARTVVSQQQEQLAVAEQPKVIALWSGLGSGLIPMLTFCPPIINYVSSSSITHRVNNCPMSNDFQVTYASQKRMKNGLRDAYSYCYRLHHQLRRTIELLLLVYCYYYTFNHAHLARRWELKRRTPVITNANANRTITTPVFVPFLSHLFFFRIIIRSRI